MYARVIATLPASFFTTRPDVRILSTRCRRRTCSRLPKYIRRTCPPAKCFTPARCRCAVWPRQTPRPYWPTFGACSIGRRYSTWSRRGGFRMSMALRNCGALDWVSDSASDRCAAVDPEIGRRCPALPASVLTLETLAAARASGSSPRMRGTPNGRGQTIQFRRFIPAHARNTFQGHKQSWVWAVHPRACGEHYNALAMNVDIPGSSPRMRGTLSRKEGSA